MRHYFALLALFVIMAGAADAVFAQGGTNQNPDDSHRKLGEKGVDKSGRHYVIKHCQRTSCFAHHAGGQYREYTDKPKH